MKTKGSGQRDPDLAVVVYPQEYPLRAVTHDAKDGGVDLRGGLARVVDDAYVREALAHAVLPVLVFCLHHDEEPRACMHVVEGIVPSLDARDVVPQHVVRPAGEFDAFQWRHSGGEGEVLFRREGDVLRGDLRGRAAGLGPGLAAFGAGMIGRCLGGLGGAGWGCGVRPRRRTGGFQEDQVDH